MAKLKANEIESLKIQVNKLKDLLDNPLPDNKAWNKMVMITISTISEYNYEDF